MSQQVWSITFNDEEVSKSEQAELLKELLQNALPEIAVTRKTTNDYVQIKAVSNK